MIIYIIVEDTITRERFRVMGNPIGATNVFYLPPRP